MRIFVIRQKSRDRHFSTDVTYDKHLTHFVTILDRTLCYVWTLLHPESISTTEDILFVILSIWQRCWSHLALNESYYNKIGPTHKIKRRFYINLCFQVNEIFHIRHDNVFIVAVLNLLFEYSSIWYHGKSYCTFHSLIEMYCWHSTRFASRTERWHLYHWIVISNYLFKFIV